MQLCKHKRVRLRGKAKHQLREDIFERDGYRCVICGNAGEEWHHHLGGIHKEDLIQKGVCLCSCCHKELHSGKNSKWFIREVTRYLNKKYWVGCEK
jgi:hypothetical protein